MDLHHPHTADGGAATDAVQVNREHWNHLGPQYSEGWATKAQQDLSEQETAFIVDHLPRHSSITALDIGIGNGRIIEALAAQPRVAAIHGVDIAPAMVAVCQEKFAGSPKVQTLSLCDISSQDLPAVPGLAFVSAIRMLKYNREWLDILNTRIAARLAPGGVLVFSMPNRASVQAISRGYAVPVAKTSEAELRRELEANGWEVLTVSGFAKVPDVVYRTLRSDRAGAALRRGERVLDRLLGRSRGARELFVAARRRVPFQPEASTR